MFSHAENLVRYIAWASPSSLPPPLYTALIGLLPGKEGGTSRVSSDVASSCEVLVYVIVPVLQVIDGCWIDDGGGLSVPL
jgi:hypothetical protein